MLNIPFSVSAWEIEYVDNCFEKKHVLLKM